MMDNIIDANPDAADIAQMLRPKERNIVPLPMAFRGNEIPESLKEGIPTKWVFHEPSSVFSDECAKLCHEIFLRIHERKLEDQALTSKHFAEWI